MLRSTWISLSFCDEPAIQSTESATDSVTCLRPSSLRFLGPSHRNRTYCYCSWCTKTFLWDARYGLGVACTLSAKAFQLGSKVEDRKGPGYMGSGWEDVWGIARIWEFVLIEVKRYRFWYQTTMRIHTILSFFFLIWHEFLMNFIVMHLKYRQLLVVGS